MIEKGPELTNIFHLAGVVPVSGLSSDFDYPWHPSLNPIGQGFLAIERAVVECAWAGCETIWIVCDDDTQPLIKHRLGDYVVDPVTIKQSKFKNFSDNHKKLIPIFYSPIHPKDRDRRDSLAWSTMHGMLSAFVTSNKISKWVLPSRYFVSFPYGVYDPEIVYQHRADISSKSKVVLQHCGSSVLNSNTCLSFTASPEDYKNCVWHAKNACSGNNKSLPLHERWSSRDLDIKTMMSGYLKEDIKKIDVNWYFSIDNWDNYSYYLSSEHFNSLKRPNKEMLRASLLKGIQIE